MAAAARDPQQLHLVEPLDLPRGSLRYAFAHLTIPTWTDRAMTDAQCARYIDRMGEAASADFDARR